MIDILIPTCDNCKYAEICKLMAEDYRTLRNSSQCLACTDKEHKIIILAELTKTINKIINSSAYKTEIFKIEEQMKELCKTLDIEITFNETEDTENRYFNMSPLTEEADKLLLLLQRLLNSEELSNKITETVNEIEAMLLKKELNFSHFTFTFKLPNKEMLIEFERASEMISVSESYEGESK